MPYKSTCQEKLRVRLEQIETARRTSRAYGAYMGRFYLKAMGWSTEAIEFILL